MTSAASQLIAWSSAAASSSPESSSPTSKRARERRRGLDVASLSFAEDLDEVAEGLGTVARRTALVTASRMARSLDWVLYSGACVTFSRRLEAESVGMSGLSVPRTASTKCDDEARAIESGCAPWGSRRDCCDRSSTARLTACALASRHVVRMSCDVVRAVSSL